MQSEFKLKKALGTNSVHTATAAASGLLAGSEGSSRELVFLGSPTLQGFCLVLRNLRVLFRDFLPHLGGKA